MWTRKAARLESHGRWAMQRPRLATLTLGLLMLALWAVLGWDWSAGSKGGKPLGRFFARTHLPGSRGITRWRWVGTLRRTKDIMQVLTRVGAGRWVDDGAHKGPVLNLPTDFAS